MSEELTQEELELKKEAKRARDRIDQRNKRERDKDKKKKTAKIDPVLLDKLQQLDRTEKYFHKSECRSRAECYALYIEHAAGEEILGKKITFEHWLRLRDVYRKNLYLLAKHLLGFPDLVYRVHKPVCDTFVKKNFDGIYYDGFTISDIKKAFRRLRESRAKEALILDPRGFFKTSLDLADIVQWLLICPEIRILLLTAEHGRSIELLEAVKTYFAYDEESETVSDFLLLYPEYRITGVDATSSKPLDCPARIIKRTGKRVGASLWVKSQSSQKTGSHADVIKRDDIVTPENSRTPELREGVKESADDTANLLDGHSFMDTIGTRYAGGDEPDYYGVMLRREFEQEAEGKGLEYFVRPCWTVKPEYAHVKLKDLTEEMVNLTFPELDGSATASFKALRKKLLDNERSFRNQQLNEPIDSAEDSPFKASFNLDQLRANSYAYSAAPQLSETFMAWDLAAKDNLRSDFSAGAVCRMFQLPQVAPTDVIQWGISVLEVVYGKWKQSELAIEIVKFRNKWNPSQAIYIEDAAGADTLKEKIRIESWKRGTGPVNIRWVVPSNLPNAKANRIKGLEILLQEGRLKFVNGAWIDETFSQFERFTGEKGNKGRKDDIPDAISFLVRFLPGSSQPNANLESLKKEEEEREKEAQKRAIYAAYFGNQTQKPKPSIVAPPIARPTVNTQADIMHQAMKRMFGR